MSVARTQQSMKIEVRMTRVEARGSPLRFGSGFRRIYKAQRDSRRLARLYAQQGT